MVVLSGCSGGSKTKKKDGSQGGVPSTAPPGEYSSDTCSIEGTIVDDEAQVLAGAEVGLFGEAEIPSVKTAEDGGFSFSNLPPKSYVVTATKVGYETATARVDCAAASKANVQLSLRPLVTADIGYSVVYPVQAGVISCAVGHPAFSTEEIPGCDTLPGNQKNKRTIKYERDTFDITGLMFEMAWTPSNPTLGGKWLALSFPPVPDHGNVTATTDDRLERLGNPGSAQDFSLGKIRGQSPINLRLEAKPGGVVYNATYAYATSPEFTAGVARPEDFNDFQQNPLDDAYSGVLMNQRFELHMAFFYNHAPIPAGFTMLG